MTPNHAQELGSCVPYEDYIGIDTSLQKNRVLSSINQPVTSRGKIVSGKISNRVIKKLARLISVVNKVWSLYFLLERVE